VVDIAETVELVITIAALAVAVASMLAAVYIVNIYRQRHEEALFLDRLVKRDIRVSIASAVILAYIALALLDLSPGRPWGSLIISLCVMAMMYGPISDALLWFRERRKK
jgi:divalent metal cation (Fe/Co/Zn/Cd) transporter